MFQAFVITLREGLEAFLIVAISLAYLRKTGRHALARAVYWGIAAALAASAVGGYLLYGAANQEQLEGPLALIAAASVAWMVVHMWRAGRRMKSEIEQRLSESSRRSGAAAFAGVFLFTLLMVAREGMETALLLLQLQESLHLVLGAIAGFVGAAVVAAAWSRFGHRVDLGLFFQVTAIFLIVFVVQLCIYGVHEMSEQNFLPYSAFIHEHTEAWSPDSQFGHLLTYMLVILPLGWLLLKSAFKRRPAVPPGAAPPSISPTANSSTHAVSGV
jgi:high-affinity iron transporter